MECGCGYGRALLLGTPIIGLAAKEKPPQEDVGPLGHTHIGLAKLARQHPELNARS